MIAWARAANARSSGTNKTARRANATIAHPIAPQSSSAVGMRTASASVLLGVNPVVVPEPAARQLDFELPNAEFLAGVATARKRTPPSTTSAAAGMARPSAGDTCFTVMWAGFTISLTARIGFLGLLSGNGCVADAASCVRLVESHVDEGRWSVQALRQPSLGGVSLRAAHRPAL